MSMIERLKQYEPLFDHWYYHRLIKEYEKVCYVEIINEYDNQKKVLIMVHMDGNEKEISISLKQYTDIFEIESLNTLSSSPYSAFEQYYIEDDDKITGLDLCFISLYNYEETSSDNLSDIELYQLGYQYFYGRGKIHNVYIAYELLKKAYDLGYIDACSILGMCYKYGYGVSIDENKAFDVFEYGAKLGEPYSMLQIGRMYENGIGTSIDYSKSVYWYIQASHYTDRAYFYLGDCYYYGNGVEKDIQKAIECYEIAAKDNSLFSLVRLGLIYDDDNSKKNIEKAFYYFLQAAEAGYPLAQYIVGKCYFVGHGIEKSLDTAIYYYDLAAKSNQVLALYELGLCYYKGTGVDKNIYKAIDLFTQGGQLGNLDCISELIDIYMNGKGVKVNIHKAMKWMRMSITFGSSNYINILEILEIINN